MKKLDHNTIIFGIGNNGRQDDGLGWSFLALVETESPPFDLEYRYQLQIEDAELISKYENVIFVDACKTKIEGGFKLYPCVPEDNYSFSTHALAPETILYITKKLYNHEPNAQILAIQGENWDLKIGLSNIGEGNLVKAYEYFKDEILSKNFILNKNY
ncbi:hydrogenase maturation protease [Winogradskyella alexanderae]|uniref:Hydrogenase maturation protease n=1 Tax=Winogradskyella alexanderae TaxID=2877123 RepID=A0ABS7XTE3_9FLAO|nr:hydrogenase maturation protease [Winogradskyella alexanderae]MCA0132276.1 hydrogenase maturation protease [Winogradskyella alexanderae]